MKILVILLLTYFVLFGFNTYLQWVTPEEPPIVTPASEDNWLYHNHIFKFKEK